jgi:hypothetical protein
VPSQKRSPKNKNPHPKKPGPRSSVRARAESPRAIATAIVAAVARAGRRKAAAQRVATPMTTAKILAHRVTESSKRASALKIPDAVAMVAGGNAVAAVVIVTGSVAGRKPWKRQVTTLSSPPVRMLPTEATSRVSAPAI